MPLYLSKKRIRRIKEEYRRLSQISMPDIAEYLIKKDDLALHFLDYLRKKGNRYISTQEFLRDFGENNPFICTLLPTYLRLLRTAQLATEEADPKSHGDLIIKLTERGQTLQYAGQK